MAISTDSSSGKAGLTLDGEAKRPLLSRWMYACSSAPLAKAAFASVSDRPSTARSSCTSSFRACDASTVMLERNIRTKIRTNPFQRIAPPVHSITKDPPHPRTSTDTSTMPARSL